VGDRDPPGLLLTVGTPLRGGLGTDRMDEAPLPSHKGCSKKTGTPP
jgi:hypothetical protein